MDKFLAAIAFIALITASFSLYIQAYPPDRTADEFDDGFDDGTDQPVTLNVLNQTNTSARAVSGSRFNFQQCAVVDSEPRDGFAQTTCNNLCDRKTCVLGLVSVSTENTQTSELNSQEVLISCKETTPYGTLQEGDEVADIIVSCICC